MKLDCNKKILNIVPCAMICLCLFLAHAVQAESLTKRIDDAVEQMSVTKLAQAFNEVEALRTNYDISYYEYANQMTDAINAVFATRSDKRLKTMGIQMETLWPDNSAIYFDWQSRLMAVWLEMALLC
jgi:hypothetical protein